MLEKIQINISKYQNKPVETGILKPGIICENFLIP
jgi:hypothetical protein